jgi:uncharacterized protein (TIGR00299 family) protein
VTGPRHAWLDASAGIAGDMLLGALLDAGARLDAVQAAVAVVLPGAVRITATPVTRAGLRALKVDIEPLVDDPPGRRWRDIRDLLHRSPLRARVSDRALAAFTALAEAEAHVHGVAAEDVHFHELGAVDSIADVVGVCAALDDLDVTTLSAGTVAVGSGRVHTAHGELPVPVPAVAHLAVGWRIRGGGEGELATPTGMALLRSLAVACEELPDLLVESIGVGAGSRDPADRPNVVRAVLGSAPSPVPDAEAMLLLETNVDDLDPRLWPGVLARLLGAGAADAWLVPIVMKKGRPAHTLSVLCQPVRAPALRAQIFRDTSTLGIRASAVRRTALPRRFVTVAVAGGTVAIKVAHRDGVIVQVTPEFDNVAELARRQDRPERLVLSEALAAAAAHGLAVGSPLPAGDG